MSDETSRYALPLLSAGQAQKEVFHNEALVALDALAFPTVAGPPLAEPPPGAAAGEAWIVGEAAAGAWAGHPGAVASWSDGGWRFQPLPDGALVWRNDIGTWTIRYGGAWRADGLPVAGIVVAGQRVVGAQQPPVADPAGGATVDTEARAAIAQLLAAVRAHGLIAAG